MVDGEGGGVVIMMELRGERERETGELGPARGVLSHWGSGRVRVLGGMVWVDGVCVWIGVVRGIV